MVYKSKEGIKYICIINVAGKNSAICELQKLLDSIIYEYENPSKNINIEGEFKNLQFIFREITEIDDNGLVTEHSVLKDSELLKLCQKQEIYDNTETWIEDDNKRNIKIKECDLNHYDKKKENFKIIINISYTPNMQSNDFIYDELCDPLIMQYLLLITQKLEKKDLKYLLLISNNNSQGNESRNYFQLRHSLRIYQDLYESVRKHFYIMSGNTPTHIYTRGSENDKYGRIFPFIPLTNEYFDCLVNYNMKGNTLFEQVYNGFLADFPEDSQNLIRQICRSECLSDNVLTRLLFIYTLHYMQDSNEWKYAEKELHVIHEVCVDYSEGIQQLIENAIIHSIHKTSEESEEGCGVFTIRIRKKEDSKYLSNDLNNKDVFKNTKFFMELYVTDLSYVRDDYKGIVEKFKENVKTRDVEGEYKDKFEALELAQLFGAKESVDLNGYFQQAKNIAFHFGLQILANTVELSKGYMFVRSGNEDKSKCIYENKNKILINGEEKNIYKVSNNFEWHDGTAYIIYLPIALREEISNVDIPAVEINNDIEMKQGNKIIYVFDNLPALDSDDLEAIIRGNKFKKEKLVEILTKILFMKKSDNEDMIYVIDCLKLQEMIDKAKDNKNNDIDVNLKVFLVKLAKYNLYEILAKAIFHFIAERGNNEEQKMKIAVINVEDRFKVINLLRQFMLFYRRGESELIKGKSIFIIDKEAELDVLLFDLINRIAENMYLSQLTGGLDGKAMEIIRYFAESRSNGENSDVR